MLPQDRQQVQRQAAVHKRAESAAVPTQLQSANPEGGHLQLQSSKGWLLQKLPYSLLHPLSEPSEGQLAMNSTVCI